MSAAHPLPCKLVGRIIPCIFDAAAWVNGDKGRGTLGVRDTHHLMLPDAAGGWGRYTVFGPGWYVQSGVAARCVHRQTGVGVSTRFCPYGAPLIYPVRFAKPYSERCGSPLPRYKEVAEK